MDHYIGLDAHSKTCTFVAMDSSGKIVREGFFKTSESGLKSMVKSLEGDVAVVLEETNISHWIYNTIKPHAKKVIVCHAAHLPKKSGPKTDYRDALHLVKQLRAENLTPVHHDDDEGLMDLRSVVSSYQGIVDSIVQQKNRFKAILRSEGIEYNLTKLKSKRIEQSNKIKSIPKQTVAKRIIDHIEALETIKSSYAKDFHNNRYRNQHIRNLRTIPGIGPIRAHTIAAYISTGHRFENKHKLWAYSKLVRHQDVSDGFIYSKRTPQGRSELKNAFMGAALKIVISLKENALKAYYRNLVIEKHLDHKKARKALARKIAAIALVTLKKEIKYNDQLATIRH